MAQKLYTEEQVKDMLSGAMFEHHIVEFLNKYYTPISLPSDEEVEKEASDFGKKYRATTYEKSAYVIGAKWMRDKIQGGNK